MRVRHLLRLAVDDAGRRSAAAPVVDVAVVDDLLRRRDPATLLVVLDHAGPAAAVWARERPVGACAVPETTTGRVPRALDEQGWQEVERSFVTGATVLRRAGIRPVLALDDDGLLHGCLSPLMGDAPVARAEAIVAACAPCDVLVVVEDLAPGGIDATTGIALARRFASAAQATTLYATCGTIRLAPLSRRTKGAAVDERAHFLASATWCVGRVDRPVVAVGHAAATDSVLLARARALGLSGVVRAADHDPGATSRSP